MRAETTYAAEASSALRRTLVMILVLGAGLSLVPRAAAAEPPKEVVVIRVPDGGIHPQAAVDTRGRVHLVYFKGEAMHGNAFYTRSDDGGTKFAKPIRVNSHADSVIVTGTVRGPHMALGRGDRVHVAWMGSSKAEPKSGKLAPMLYTRLNEAGDAFEPQRNVAAAHPGLDGGGSVAADADGNVYVAWHAPAEYGKSEGEEGRHVWVSRSQDDGKTFAPEVAANPIPNGVCACCGMRIFAGDKGRVFVLYRSASDMVDRDVQMLVSVDRAKTFTVAAADPWKIGQCVMSTASFARGPAGDVLGAWETKNQIRLGRVDASAQKTGTALDAPGDGKNRKHPSVAVNAKGEILLAWTEGTGWNKGGSVAWQLYDTQGQPLDGRSGREKGLPAWGVPAAIALPDGTFRVIY